MSQINLFLHLTDSPLHYGHYGYKEKALFKILSDSFLTVLGRLTKISISEITPDIFPSFCYISIFLLQNRQDIFGFGYVFYQRTFVGRVQGESVFHTDRIY